MDEIDRIDDDIAELVAERVRTAEAVADVKLREGRDLVDENREATVKSHYEAVFRRQGLDAESGSDFAEFLIETSLEQEKQVKERSR